MLLDSVVLSNANNSPRIDTGCPDPALTIDTLRALHKITQLLCSSINTDFYPHKGHAAWSGRSLHHLLSRSGSPARCKSHPTGCSDLDPQHAALPQPSPVPGPS